MLLIFIPGQHNETHITYIVIHSSCSIAISSRNDGNILQYPKLDMINFMMQIFHKIDFKPIIICAFTVKLSTPIVHCCPYGQIQRSMRYSEQQMDFEPLSKGNTNNLKTKL